MTGSVCCLEMPGISYAVTWNHIPGEWRPYMCFMFIPIKANKIK